MTDSRDPSIDQYLEPGERLLWSGAPATGLRVRRSDGLMIPFSLLWGGFAFFWELMALTNARKTPQGWFFALWGVPFVAVGSYMVVGRFIDDAWIRRNTEYAVTDSRILILKGRFGRSLTALPLRTLAIVELTGGSGGLGSIRLGQPAYRSAAPPALEFLADAKNVFSIIESARRKAAS